MNRYLPRLLLAATVALATTSLLGCDNADEHNAHTPASGKGGGDGYGGVGTGSNAGGYTQGDRAPLGGSDAHDAAGPNK